MSGLNWQMVARREVHPARVAILQELAGADGPMSPKQLAEVLPRQTLGRVSYHVRELAKTGLLELVDTKPRRGAVEHFYRIADEVRDGD